MTERSNIVTRSLPKAPLSANSFSAHIVLWGCLSIISIQESKGSAEVSDFDAHAASPFKPKLQ